MKKLTTKERALLRTKFEGCCAYCGQELPARWHADHFKPILRHSVWRKGKGFVPTGKLSYPEHDILDNYMPSCAPCNLDKGSSLLEQWRERLSNVLDVLTRNYPTYGHAKRFGLIQETPHPIVFHFEKVALEHES